MLVKQHGTNSKHLIKTIVIFITILGICNAGAQKESTVINEITFQWIWVEGKVEGMRVCQMEKMKLFSGWDLYSQDRSLNNVQCQTIWSSGWFSYSLIIVGPEIQDDFTFPLLTGAKCLERGAGGESCNFHTSFRHPSPAYTVCWILMRELYSYNRHHCPDVDTLW